MSAAWDSFPALSPVPWGERSREAFNCVPGDQQSAPLVNSFGVCDGAETVDHRGDGSRGATNGCAPMQVANRSREARAWAAAGLLIAGALSRAGCARGRRRERIVLDHAGVSSENWRVMLPLVSFAAHPRSM
jgi:hypothetical protein